ncbi:GntR family transcriptional regulator [Fictibacillus enclensis]|uniref:GntR family transcriptional regulator n=1 Tax=Fictibacillus enclensis TaxID=1017270 RepID=UPI0025A28026|nr:GntR family transcriptional regulator [Fictibacillus enclensis]MDM5200582.1 GntR family transcriptional regulator [Fictibacillus enclensis]
MKAKPELRIENRDTLHLKVTNVIREAIIRGDFKPGERLKQSDLAEQLGVSRMPVREAFRKLEAEGLIQLEPHKGAIIKSIHKEELEEIYTLRAEMERMAVVQAADLLTQEDLDALKALVEKMEVETEPEEFVLANIEFHKLLIKRCTWNRLTNFISTLWSGLPQQTPHLISGQIEKSKIEHREIYEALDNKDKEKAGRLVSQHILRTGEMLIQSLSKDAQ